MRVRTLMSAMLAGLAAGACFGQARAEPARSAPSQVPGWDEVIEQLRGLPDRMLAKLPPDLQRDPQIRQEVARLALQSLMVSSMDAVSGDGDFPEFLPSWGMLLNIAQPNVDTIYKMARITPGGSYRITGARGSAEVAVVSQAIRRKEGAGGSWPELDLTKLKTDANGRYDVILSPTRPAGHTGDWWELSPDAHQLMVRFISSDWKDATAPSIAIERIDRPMGLPRRSASDLEGRLRGISGRTEAFATMFLDRARKLRDEGFVNRFKTTVPAGALERQSNYEGAYEVADDEALIVETELPETCEYRSLLLINDLYQTVDWYDNFSSLNGEEAAPDKDGKLRIVVSARDPGVRNWIDTSGHARGVLKGRWTGCSSHPTPEIRKVKLADLAGSLPKDVARVTPAERDQMIRERRRAMQERRLW